MDQKVDDGRLTGRLPQFKRQGGRIEKKNRPAVSRNRNTGSEQSPKRQVAPVGVGRRALRSGNAACAADALGCRVLVSLPHALLQIRGSRATGHLWSPDARTPCVP